MSLDDRDYMRRPAYTPPVPRHPWWQKLNLKTVVAAAVAVAALVSATAWFLRDASYIASFLPSREGTLIVNVNTATTDELKTLPGIGPALATLIVAGRPYANVEDLERVKGIGSRTVESLRPYVKVDGETEEVR
ncbi:MAG: ComEA family DNA-binding protein [Gammaproteobacteria bacterium]